jgi:hypothetical protein
MSNNEFKTLTYDFKAIGADIRRRAAIVHRLNRFQFPPKVIRKFTEGFVYAKLRYMSPLLGGEKPTASFEPIEKGLRAALRTELGAFKSTPIPLLYIGAQRPYSQRTNQTRYSSAPAQYRSKLHPWKRIS